VPTQLGCLKTCKITVGALVLIFASVRSSMDNEIALELESFVAEIASVVGFSALR
jgi:hypothetical protein